MLHSNKTDLSEAGANGTELINALEVKACTITSEIPNVLTKTRSLDINTGSIITHKAGNARAGAIIKGYATNTTFRSMKQLASFLDNAKLNEALIASTHIAKTDTTGIMSTGHYKTQGEPTGFITRTKDNFTRNKDNQGLLILDCDDTSISKDQFLNAVKQIIPDLDDIAHVYTTSSSSYLYNGDTLLQGDKGKRLYIAIQDSSDITRAGQALFDRLWLKGYGYYEIGKAGQYLNRGIIDTAMFKDSCRLDFISGSNCKPPLKQARPPAEYKEGRPLDSYKELPPLNDTEMAELQAKQTNAMHELKPLSEKTRKSYCKARGIEHLEKQGITDPTETQLETAITNVTKALDQEVLTGDFIITLANEHRQVTIGEVLANREQYHLLETLDPLEPEYNNYHVTGKLFLDDDNPSLHSFAHGGKAYKLFEQERFIKHTKGNTAKTTAITLDLMRVLDFYDMGKQLVIIRNGHVIPMNEHLLTYELGTRAQFYMESEGKEGDIKRIYIDPPLNVVKQILSMNGQTGGGNTQRGLKPLKGVITAPTITADNHIVYKRGYDTKTQLYLATDSDLNPPASNPSQDELKQAYGLIMGVIDTFKLNTDLDRSIILSAFLTAVARPGIDKAPIYALDAPTQGSGKTYLAECLGLLSTGHAPAITPAIQGNEAETQKTLLSMLLNGTRTIIWDNIMGSYNSATMAAFVTAITYSGRVLGASDQIELPNKAMVIFTGNNLNLYGDLPRRCITARIDTGEENPLNTKRDLSGLAGLKPDQFIDKNRIDITMACITIIRAFLSSDCTSYTGNTIASFTQWDAMSRQPILHLASTGIAPELLDIKESIDSNMANDSEMRNLSELTDYLYTLFKEKAFTAKEVMNTIYDFTGQPANSIGAEVIELLVDIGKRTPTSRSLGKILSNRKDRIADGRKIVELTTGGKHANRYRIEVINQET